MNRVKLTIKSEDGKTLCKIGTSINPPAGDEYSDQELAALLLEMADNLKTKAVISKWKDVLNAPTSRSVKAMLIESQETPYEMQS